MKSLLSIILLLCSTAARAADLTAQVKLTLPDDRVIDVQETMPEHYWKNEALRQGADRAASIAIKQLSTEKGYGILASIQGIDVIYDLSLETMTDVFKVHIHLKDGVTRRYTVEVKLMPASAPVPPRGAYDAFSGNRACSLTDAKPIRAWTREEAEDAARRCAAELGQYYGVKISVSFIRDIYFSISAGSANAKQAQADISSALAKRGNLFFGYPAWAFIKPDPAPARP